MIKKQLLHPNIKISPIEISSADIVNRMPSPSGNKLAIIRSFNNEQLQQKQHWLETWIDNGVKYTYLVMVTSCVISDNQLYRID